MVAGFDELLVGRRTGQRQHSGRHQRQPDCSRNQPQGETVWEWTAADAPGYKFSNTQVATRLANGNTLINNWFSQPVDKMDPSNAPVQAIEVTPDKKIVWALRSWTPPADLGPSTTIQILNKPGLAQKGVLPPQ